MTNIKDLTYEQLLQVVSDLGGQSFRAGQIFTWLHQKNVTTFEQMSNVPAPLREALAAAYTISSPKIIKKLVSKIDGTVKYLFELADGETVESVLMRYKHGNSICISTQVGCKMGCSFCASTIAGFVRSLTAGEMLGQITAAAQDLGERISHVVLMGIGEPLDNFEQTLNFIKNATSEKGMNLSSRHIALSTCGLVDKIDLLAKEGIPITLCISLHAPTDLIRSQLMPINKTYQIPQLMAACKRYIAATSRRITFEYTLIDGVNDSVQCAQQLAQLCKDMLCHVNLIPVNHVKETGFYHSAQSKMEQFCNILEKNKVNVTLRRTLGQDISAACGQLRRKEMEK